MFLENNTPVKSADNSETSSIKYGVNNISILEEDLALSSSTIASLQRIEKTSENESTQYKLTIEENEEKKTQYKLTNKVVYLNEETMDCCYPEKINKEKIIKSVIEQASSPEMFDSDDDDDDNVDDNNDKANNRRSTFNRILSKQFNKETTPPYKPSQEEMILKSDNYLMTKINKYLSGVPPPPRHTICQKDCNDFLTLIKENHRFFWINNPFMTDDKTTNEISDNNELNLSSSSPPPSSSLSSTAAATTTRTTDNNKDNNIKAKNNEIINKPASLRNLTNAFDECDVSSSSISNIKINSNDNIDNNINYHTNSETTSLPPATSYIESSLNDNNNIKRVKFDIPQNENLAIFKTIDVINAKDLPWSLAYGHKAPGIHYNRNKYIEDFENLTINLYERYVGNETQSTCTSWFNKNPPNSVKKRGVLCKRNIGQSPGKRLSHLARRRRTFSSANLQGMSDKRQIVLNIKKLTNKKGKSPRNSAKKKLIRRLSIDNKSSPRKTKLEISKRALFQSPPTKTTTITTTTTTATTERPGPSQINQKIKRTLFKSPVKIDDNDNLSKKRKSCDELDGPKLKWSKSLSFDNFDQKNNSWNDRYSMNSVNIKTQSVSQPVTTEMSDTNRKKLLWAVSQALRLRGITMTHPKFKLYATQIAKKVKNSMPELENLNIPRKPGSTTDRMLKYAKRQVILTVEPATQT